MMATAEYFNLSGNSFTNVQEGTALYDMVHRMTNWGKREVIQWSKTNGGGEFTTIPDEMFVFKNLVQLDLSYNPGLTGEKNCSTHATHLTSFSHSHPGRDQQAAKFEGAQPRLHCNNK
jgi:hypothetical protein